MIQLSEHFTYKKLLRFVIPSIVMMIFTSIYNIVDGFFVSNFAGKTALASINLILPIVMGLASFGFMIGTGGSAIVAKTFGEGKKEKANEYFSMLVYATIILGIILSIAGSLLVPHIAKALGAQGELLSNSILYARINFISLPAFMLQNVFQSFFVTAEKPKIGLCFILLSGFTNIILDIVLVAILGFGLTGAALATVCGEMLGGFAPLLYFPRKNSSLLKLGKTKFYGRTLYYTCINGSSELMTNISSSIVNSLYNLQLMKFAGENGVAAYGFIMYVNFIFVAIYIGYSMGSAPIISYNYGAGNHNELKNMFKKSLTLVAIWGICLASLAQLLNAPLSKMFVGYDEALLNLTQQGFRIYALVFLLSGFDIFGSSFFTALNNGVVSAVISFLRTLVFQIGAVIILPAIYGLNGIWSAVVVAEALTLLVTITCLVRYRKRYHYA